MAENAKERRYKEKLKKIYFFVTIHNLKIKLTVCEVRIVINLFSVKKHMGFNQNLAPAKEMHLYLYFIVSADKYIIRTMQSPVSPESRKTWC